MQGGQLLLAMLGLKRSRMLCHDLYVVLYFCETKPTDKYRGQSCQQYLELKTTSRPCQHLAPLRSGIESRIAAVSEGWRE